MSVRLSIMLLDAFEVVVVVVGESALVDGGDVRGKQRSAPWNCA